MTGLETVAHISIYWCNVSYVIAIMVNRLDMMLDRFDSPESITQKIIPTIVIISSINFLSH